jgi:hypothetical protein
MNSADDFERIHSGEKIPVRFQPELRAQKNFLRRQMNRTPEETRKEI